jgi:hypothetical protein
VFAEYSHCYLTVDELTSRVVVHWEFWVSIVLFFALCSAAIILAVIKQYKLPPVQAFKVGIIIIMSAPFIYAVMRGNTIYFAMIFLLLFVLLYQNEKAYVREIGYLCLVFAGLIKIYPLFFGVFLLHKKKIWASFRIAVYFFALFFLSFFLFEGGMYHLAPFIKNLGGFASSSDRLVSGNNLSLTSFVFKLLAPMRIPFAVIDTVSTVLTALIFLAATVCAVYTKSDFSRFAIASAIGNKNIMHFHRYCLFLSVTFPEDAVSQPLFPPPPAGAGGLRPRRDRVCHPSAGSGLCRTCACRG